VNDVDIGKEIRTIEVEDPMRAPAIPERPARPMPTRKPVPRRQPVEDPTKAPTKVPTMR